MKICTTHQHGRPQKFFDLYPIVLNYVQHIFPGGEKNFLGGGLNTLPFLHHKENAQFYGNCCKLCSPDDNFTLSKCLFFVSTNILKLR